MSISKRQLVPDEDITQRKSKKPRVEERAAESPEEIANSRHLQSLLIFEQDAPRLLQSIRAFKVFLESIVYPTDEDDVPHRRAILREFLDSQTSRSNDEESVYLPDLMQMWSFAAQSNNDKLLSASSAIVALLLKTLSNHIDFRDSGLLLCKTLLQQTQLRLLSRGLASRKDAEFLISPCLRVLTEIVSFDGGVLAKSLYNKRDLLLDMQTMGRNLRLRRAQSEDPEENLRKPSVRTNAVKYLLSNFKFQNETAKMDMLKQSNVMKALIDGIEHDPPQIIAEIVSSLRQYIIRDKAILKRSKSFTFTERNLSSLCRLYRVELPDIPGQTGQRPLVDQVHDLMLDICASSEMGIVIPFGWYPPNPDDADGPGSTHHKPTIDLGLDSLDWYGSFANEIPLRNKTIGEFIYTLRPHAYEKERQLLMAIFNTAPELVAFFFHKIAPNFVFSPKLTSTWVGYAAFVFSTVQLLVPKLYNRLRHLPPPIGIVIESILPLPLNQKVLHNCLSGGAADLVKFFAVRLLTVAFEKLKAVLRLFRDNVKTHGTLWEQACNKLAAEFIRRCPPLKDATTVLSTLHKSPKNNCVQREETARLISMYYDVTPQAALDQKFDISVSLANSLKSLDNLEESSEDRELNILELSHLVKVARWSPSMNWWNKAKGHQFSPFMSLLRLVIDPEDEPQDIKLLLESMMRENGALQNDTAIPALDCLIVSLKSVGGTKAADAVFEFLDDCFHHFLLKPIKYEDDHASLCSVKSHNCHQDAPASLLWHTIVEQWQFVEKTRNESMRDIAKWISKFSCLVLVAGETPVAAECTQINNSDADRVLANALQELSSTEREALAEILRHYSEEVVGVRGTEASRPGKQNGLTSEPFTHPSDRALSLTSDAPTFDISAFAPTAEDPKHTALTSWTRKDVPSIVDDGDLSSLILHLTSTDPSVRRQTMNALQNLNTKVQSSSYVEQLQMYMLIGGLIETASPIIDNGNPFSGLAATFAARTVGVLADPTHVLYEKICEYLNLGPSWRVGKMVGYWTDQIILHPPSDDAEGSYYREIIWLLEWLEDGIRSVEDVEPLRWNGVFEKLFSLFCHDALEGYGSTGSKVVEMFLDREVLDHGNSLQGKIRPLILRILARAVAVGGGETLVTRTGVLAWLGIVKSKGWLGGVEGDKVIEQMEGFILASCEGKKINQWSGGLLSIPERNIDAVSGAEER